MNLFKIVPWFIGLAFTLIILGWIVMGVLMYKGISSVNEVGAKGMVEQLWCGKDTNCKLPDVLK
jgi:hypothetical protein